MHLLLDTHIILWWLADDESFHAAQRAAIMDRRNSCYISSASIWEIAIKAGLGKLEILLSGV